MSLEEDSPGWRYSYRSVLALRLPILTTQGMMRLQQASTSSVIVGGTAAALAERTLLPKTAETATVPDSGTMGKG